MLVLVRTSRYLTTRICFWQSLPDCLGFPWKNSPVKNYPAIACFLSTARLVHWLSSRSLRILGLNFFFFFLNHEINWDICIKLHVNVWKLVLPQPSLKLVRILSSYFFQKNKICLYSSFGKHVCHFFAKKPLHREKKAICFCLLINIKIIYINKLFNWISVLLFLIFFCFLFLLTPSVISFDSPTPKILNQRFKKSTILNSRPLRANNSQNTSPW